MHIEDLTREVECTFRDYAIDRIPARIAQLEDILKGETKRLNSYIERMKAGKKMQRHHMVALRRSPDFIQELTLIIRALREGYAHRTA